MKALTFHPTIPRFVATKVAGAVSRRAWWGRWAPLQLREVPDPPLPGEDWVRVAVRLGGICGSDLHTIRLEASPALSALTSFPFVLGHENVGTIAEVGPAVRDLRIGQRVTVEPALPCLARGLVDPCPPCAAGNYNLCLRVAEGHLAPGLMIGACRDTGGSWAANFVAHRSQVFPLPEAVSDENALLAEPLAVTAHAVVASPPAEADTVLVVGGGVIGQCAIAALRASGSGARIIALVKHGFQGEAARRLGADEVVRLQRGDGHYPAIADLTGGRLRRPMMGKRVLLGGADLTLECVGSAGSIDDSLRLTRPGGRVVLLGLASWARSVDWTPLWLKELQVTGSYIYRWETWRGRRVRTMEIVLDWMARGLVDLSHLVTHQFPLEEFRRALHTAMGKAATRAFKVAFRPQA
ncbi:MAG: alcohol dehydrogenase catalytic domain-containing protein [Armatimonadota bacterium]|nr:alcohol dehydrogenase catalytic domain-containing protein [Armatimonadota bacterium]MDR7468327.1 alcohol dehydrogenase catalytic domain-containing protein [Armatimonadota bacterium]MDR7500008.1 alcohol dehydrogenase catalytic domain-containing protein [Armatimonadota bacterium]MDR7505895.1 alcohol dehydrogenase catalytic domain-containing protein [Armatimonadota bacterium]MDR7552805.1 alcohol dehydrogenase catalytic domain-containing protein [Armatimonadota bacterium]